MDYIEQLVSHFDAILDLMPDEFDSHMFTLKLFHQRERLYVHALANYVNNPHPVRTVNSRLAIRLSQGDYPVEKLGKVKSPNIFGHETECELWRKS